MASKEIEALQQQLEEAFTTFRGHHPEVVEAMETMNLSFEQYLQAMASLKEAKFGSGNASVSF